MTQAPSTSSAIPDWLRGDTRPRWRRPSTWLLLIGLLALIALAFWLWQRAQLRDAPRYLTEPLVRGDLAITVSANGTLQPTRSVNIGSELSGTVARVLVDVNDRVKKGQVLVELDTAKFIDQVNASQAAVASANAAVLQAQATAEEARLSLERLEKVSRLSGGRVPAATDLDTARATLHRAEAAQAAAAADVQQAQATLSTNRTNLSKASIRSPIDGTVLSRSVEPGIAVAASLQAVTLLTLAEDLGHMKLSVDVDEADVGQVRLGQVAQFTVSAWPNRKYPATITRVAYGSTTTDNVVTYTTEMSVENPDLTLRPGMTVNAVIAATERKGVLLVPRAALSFSPKGESNARGTDSGNFASRLIPRGPTSPARTARADLSAGSAHQLWVLQNGQPTAIAVEVGLSNGRLTEVSGAGLKEGLPVILAQQSSATP
jgi:HlyD family secretion protein